MRKTCQRFLSALFKQLQQRLPNNIATLKNISLFSVNNVLQPIKDIPAFCNVMKYLDASDSTIASAKYQLNKINLIDWQNKENTEAFWEEAQLYKDAAGNNPFEELLNLAISFRVIPHSNAGIERVFSSMNIVKYKVRNSMKPELLHAILTVRFALLRKEKCCHS